MKPKHFAALAIAAAVSLAAAIAAYSAQMQRSTATPSGAKLFASFSGDAALVKAVEITQGKRSIKLIEAGGVWRHKDADGFPINVEKVRALIVALTEAELAEAKTNSPAKHKILEVEDPADENANSFLIQLKDGEGKLLAEIVTGKKRLDAFGAGRPGSYVRRPNETQAWLITRMVEPGLKLSEWTRVSLFDLRPDTIKSATIESHGESPFEIVRDTDGRSFKLAKVPDNKKMKFINASDDIVDTLSSFRIEEVRKASATPSTGGEIGRAKIEADSGLKLEITARKEADAIWMSVVASGEGEGKKAADEITQNASGWEFKMSSSQYDRAFKKITDLVEDKTP